MSVMGFQRKTVWMGGWVGGVRSIQVFFFFLEFFYVQTEYVWYTTSNYQYWFRAILG